MGVFRARLTRRVLNAAVRAFDGRKPSITRLRAAADAALDVGVNLSRRALATLEDASDCEAAGRPERRRRKPGYRTIDFDEWMKTPSMRDIALALAKKGGKKR